MRRDRVEREMAGRVLIEKEKERGKKKKGEGKKRGAVREGKYKGSFGFVLVYYLIPVLYLYYPLAFVLF